MRCLNCGHEELLVLESRDSKAPGRSNQIRRRRECASCKVRFTTYEAIDGSAADDELSSLAKIAEVIAAFSDLADWAKSHLGAKSTGFMDMEELAQTAGISYGTLRRWIVLGYMEEHRDFVIAGERRQILWTQPGIRRVMERAGRKEDDPC